MEISKSTPYVRYRENISSTLHKGTIHIESEYLDRERKTTIESIEGQTWQNMVNGENKEEDILPRLGMKIEGNEDIFDSKEQHMPIDTIVGDIEPVANEDGTYTYEISTMEGSYAKTLDGENNFSLTSDGLDGSMYIKYNAQGEEVNGNIGETTGQQITDGTDSKLIEGKIYGDTLLNVLPSPSLKNSVDYNVSMQKLNEGYDNVNVADGEFKKATLYGQTLVNLINLEKFISDSNMLYTYELPVKNNTTYTVIATLKGSDKIDSTRESVLRIKSNDNNGSELIGTQQIEPNNTSAVINIFSTIEVTTQNNLYVRLYNTLPKNLKLLIIEGDYTNQYIPYFEGMQSVVMPSLVTTSKNVFSGDNSMESGAWDTNGQPVVATNEIRCKNAFTPFPSGLKNGDVMRIVLSDTTINSDANMHIYGIDKIRINTSDSTFVDGVATIAIEDASKWKYFSFRVISTNTECKFAIMVNTSGSYEPYQSNTLTTPEEVTLRAVGDVRDEFDCVTGEVTQRIGEIVLDGSEEGWIYEGGRGSVTAICYIQYYFTTPPTNAITNYFSIVESNKELFWNASQDYEEFCLNDISLAFRIEKTKLNTLDSNGIKEWLSQNNIIIQYDIATPIIKTVDLTITNQDNQPQTVLHSIPNGYINTSSQGLLPKVDYEVPTSNLYLLDMVKPNTLYTTKSSSDCNATIDGTTYPLSANGMFTTPSTIINNLMVLDAPVDDLMFIEGDLTSRNIDYFTGINSVENPMMVIGGKNLFDVNSIPTNPSAWKDFGQAYATVKEPFMKLKPNTKYKIYGTILQKPNTNNLLKFVDEDGNELFYHSFNNSNNNNYKEFNVDKIITTTSSGLIYLITFPAYNEEWILWLKEMLKKSTVMIEEGTVNTGYEKPTYTRLSTAPQITLYGIGDVKDEWDVVNEMVTRRIGKIVLDGSENWKSTGMTYGKEYAVNISMSELIPNATIPTDGTIYLICDKLKYIGQSIHNEGVPLGFVCSYHNNGNFFIRMPASSINEVKEWLANNKPTLYCKLATPTTESVRIVPQNHRQSTTSLTLQSPLQKVGNVADQLRWNPYKGHYVRYNYIQDGVANSTYTFEDLKDMNERKFVNLYNQRTYIDTDHTVQVNSHGISRYCLAEQGKQYQVRWDWIEQPSVDTIKVDLCGNVKEISSSDNSAVINVEKFTHQFIQIQGLGLTGKITNLMVIETVQGEIPDVDFFSGIQCVGNVVQVDGVNKAEIVIEQTNGNLMDVDFIINNNGNNIDMTEVPSLIRPNKNYVIKFGNSIKRYLYVKDNNKNYLINTGANNETLMKIPYNGCYFRCYAIVSSNGSANVHFPVELCYEDMAKDGIRPRYYDKESIILPMKLCRVGNIYDNLYYDDLRGYYRIQQSIGHKYFTGETTEVWTIETTSGYRTIKFTCTSANIDQIAFGGTICNSFKHLSTINDDMEGFIIYNGNFVLRIDKDRLIDKTVDEFKALLASSPIHLFYQLKTPQMINLTEYPNRIELNTYRDEIFTFLKGMNPTKFTLSVPMDKTYRYAIAEEGQGLANRVTVNNETISAENMVAVKEVRGQGIANIIEDVNNVVITPRPNHEGRTTSHTLNNTKPAIIMVHGFEPSGDTAIGKYNVTDKAYQLKVMSSNGDNSLSDYYVLNVPYKLETYADGTKDVVYYDEAYKQWIFKGSSVKEYTVASNGTLSETIEIFRGLAPRSGMIAEFKLMFTSGTTAARMYYSLDGITYSYTQLRNMSDGNYLYVGIFNTGGAKIDIAYKTDPNAEYTNPSPLSMQVPECFMVNQITNCTFCELTLDKQYIYSEMKSPIELETYEGSTKVFMDGNATDTNIIIRNEGTSKIVNTYTDTEYTVYWKYVDGLGNLRVTLGGTTVEVDGKQEYATLKTQLNAPQELLYVGGYNLSIKDLMVVKGAKIDDLPYFEGSRQVGTLVLDEEGNKSYKITLVQGGSVLEQRDENAITFKDDNKHNVVVHKIVGVCPTKVD